MIWIHFLEDFFVRIKNDDGSDTLPGGAHPKIMIVAPRLVQDNAWRLFFIVNDKHIEFDR